MEAAIFCSINEKTADKAVKLCKVYQSMSINFLKNLRTDPS